MVPSTSPFHQQQWHCSSCTWMDSPSWLRVRVRELLLLVDRDHHVDLQPKLMQQSFIKIPFSLKIEGKNMKHKKASINEPSALYWGHLHNDWSLKLNCFCFFKKIIISIKSAVSTRKKNLKARSRHRCSFFSRTGTQRKSLFFNLVCIW